MPVVRRIGKLCLLLLFAIQCLQSSAESVAYAGLAGCNSSQKIIPKPTEVIQSIRQNSGFSTVGTPIISLVAGEPRENNQYAGGNVFRDNALTSLDSRFRVHRFASNFRYQIATGPGIYQVRLGFAEIWAPNCRIGTRVFNVLVNDVLLSELRDIDVYAQAGCQQALSISVQVASIGDEITLDFVGKVENAMVSNIEVRYLAELGHLPVTTAAPGIVSSATVTPSAATTTSRTSSSTMPREEYIDEKIDSGSKSDTLFAGGGRTFAPYLPDLGDPYSSHRYSSQFFYVMTGSPGSYELTFDWAEIWTPNCVTNGRVFDVLIQGEAIESLSNIDVFKESGCKTPLSKRVIANVKTDRRLRIDFKSDNSQAMVSGITVRALSITTVSFGSHDQQGSLLVAGPNPNTVQVESEEIEEFGGTLYRYTIHLDPGVYEASFVMKPQYTVECLRGFAVSKSLDRTESGITIIDMAHACGANDEKNTVVVPVKEESSFIELELPASFSNHWIEMVSFRRSSE